MIWVLRSIIIMLCAMGQVRAQQFQMFPVNMFHTEKALEFRNILPTSKGATLISNTSPTLVIQDKMQFTFGDNFEMFDDNGKPLHISQMHGIFRDLYGNFNGIKYVTEAPGEILYMVSENNYFGFADYSLSHKALGFPPFDFPADKSVRKLWVDPAGDLFITTTEDTLYIVEDAATIFLPRSNNETTNTFKEKISSYKVELNKDSNVVVTEGAKKIRKIHIGKDIFFYSFGADPLSPGSIYLGTNHGLFILDKSTGRTLNLFEKVGGETITITQLENILSAIKIWFSTKESGMGYFNTINETVRLYPMKSNSQKQTINAFTRKSENELFVAPGDSVPAVFNIVSGEYIFITDTVFRNSPNKSTDIKVDAAGSLFLIKGGWLYWSKTALGNPAFASVKPGKNFNQIEIEDLQVNNVSYERLYGSTPQISRNSEIELKYFENNINIFFAVRGFTHDDLITIAWKLEGYRNDWYNLPFSFADERMNVAPLLNLEPGHYRFFVRIKKDGQDWIENPESLLIIITEPIWGQWWFWLSTVGGTFLLIYGIVSWRVNLVRKQERTKSKHQLELLEMEARALRAQMNPHFIFNCLNSIKSLIVTDQKEKSVEYLTTFSKLIRRVFQNSDKKSISLYDELETCRLYTELEEMRLNGQLNWNFNIQPDIDLKSVFVPALIIQPFIENAIWHGIVPKGKGNLDVRVYASASSVICEVEDDGIGRDMSRQNKPETPVIHESKGVHLSQMRLELEKNLKNGDSEISITDKYSGDIATGTLVKLTFNLN